MIHLLTSEGQGGVRDFTLRLQQALGHDHTAFVSLSKRNASHWEVNSGDIVLLQLSSYGFDKRGAPLWLLSELQKRRKSIKTLGIFFHELYAFGPPWSSSFWLSPLQRYLAKRLAEMSNFWLTSREGSAVWLRKYAGTKPHAVIAVFSNVGEATLIPQTRLPRIIVFGSEGLRRASYQAIGDKLFAWAKRESLEVHDIGAPITDLQMTKTLRLNQVIQHGRLGDESVSQLMYGAAYGLLEYPVDYVAKSGVFAAYCAHGICPILISNNYMSADSLVAGTHYFPGLPDAEAMRRSNGVSQAAWEWYQPHSLSRHADTLNNLLRQSQVTL